MPPLTKIDAVRQGLQQAHGPPPPAWPVSERWPPPLPTSIGKRCWRTKAAHLYLSGHKRKMEEYDATFCIVEWHGSQGGPARSASLLARGADAGNPQTSPLNTEILPSFRCFFQCQRLQKRRLTLTSEASCISALISSRLGPTKQFSWVHGMSQGFYDKPFAAEIRAPAQGRKSRARTMTTGVSAHSFRLRG